MAVSEVGKFVNDDVFGYDFRGKEDAGVDDDAVFGSAASPFAFLKPDAEPGRGDFCEGCVVLNDLFQRGCADSPVEHDGQVAGKGGLIGSGEVVGDGDEEPVVGKFCFCGAAGVADNGVFLTEEGEGFAVGVVAGYFGTGGVFLYLSGYPFTFGFDEFSDFFGGDVLRHADDDGGVCFDFDCP